MQKTLEQRVLRLEEDVRQLRGAHLKLESLFTDLETDLLVKVNAIEKRLEKLELEVFHY